MSTEDIHEDKQDEPGVEAALEELALHLEAVEEKYVEEELCPPIFILQCAGVPLNPQPELVKEEEEKFHHEMVAKKDELLRKDVKAPIPKSKDSALIAAPDNKPLSTPERKQ